MLCEDVIVEILGYTGIKCRICYRDMHSISDLKRFYTYLGRIYCSLECLNHI